MAKKMNLEEYTRGDDIISINIYGGKSFFKGVRETPEEADIIRCDKTGECSFYKAGKCLKCRCFGGSDCVYGNKKTVQGFTSRAAKHSEWNHFFHSQPAYGKLHTLDINTRFGVVGEYYFFNTAFIGLKDGRSKIYSEENTFEERAYLSFCKQIFVKKEDATADWLNKLFSIKPYAMFDGIIKDYQDKIVPSLKAEMKMKAPELYKTYTEKYPDDAVVSYVGKTAYIHTLRPGCSISDRSNAFILSEDRMKLKCETFNNAFMPFGVKKMVVEIDVTEDMTCKITDNEQVTEDTVLA